MKSRLPLISWCIYGWASDTFPILITTFVFSTYFISHIAADKILGTYLWANATTMAGLIIAFVGPIFGAIADKGGHHKRWLGFFTFYCVVSSSLLWFACPSSICLKPSLILVIFGTVCLEITVIFYNAFLPILAPQKYLGRISGWGWGMGYFGGILALLAILFISVLHKPAWLDQATYEQVRIVGPFSAMWFALFSLPLFIFVPDTPSSQLPLKTILSRSFAGLKETFKMLIEEKNILLFLIARMIYNDGLNTLFAFGGIFAAGTFHFTLSDILIFGICLNMMAGLGAVLLAWLDDYMGSKPTILISLAGLSFFGLILLLTHDRLWFWLITMVMSLFVGPVQAASRSLMSHLTPPHKYTELFGIYALTGRITAFIGPWILGYTTLHCESQRAGMATILAFFLIGWALLSRVRIAKTP